MAKKEKPEKPEKPSQQFAELPPALDAKKLGRPSEYDPAYCDFLLDMGREGKSRAQMAAGLGISRKCLWQWENRYPEFGNALKEAQDLSLAWWETAGQTNMVKQGFNATAFIFQMKNRFRDDYRDAQAHEVTGKDGKDFMPDTSPRDLARAVLDVIRKAKKSEA